MSETSQAPVTVVGEKNPMTHEFQKTALISLPYHFSVRNFLYTPVLENMARHPHVRFVLVSAGAQDGQFVRSCGHRNIVHELMAPAWDRPEYQQCRRDHGIGARLSRVLYRYWTRFDEKYLFDSLTYRFNHLMGLACLRFRQAMSAEQQRLEVAFSNFAPSRIGRPFLDSPSMFSFLFALRYSRMVPSRDPWVEFLYWAYRPDVLVLSRLQFKTGVWPFLASAKKRRVPVIGVIQSWDQPTTKGPFPPGVNTYVVGSRAMSRALEQYHGVPCDRIRTVGHVYTDNYLLREFRSEREDFLSRMGLPMDGTLVTFCTNTLTLKAHEVSIARYMAQKVSGGAYGARCTLFIRPHPQDTKWETDFASMHAPPHIVVSRGSGFGYYPDDSKKNAMEDTRFLTNLMRHSAVVINTGSSVALDAIAFDTPVICLGFDGDRTPAEPDRVIVRYEWEHLRSLLVSGGIWLVRSYAELDQAVAAYLANPRLHAEGRKQTRQDHLEPLDGRASERMVDLIVDYAHGRIPDDQALGHWEHRGLYYPPLSEPQL
jgi:hypothetical protein